jgi:hypothetical protein
LFWLVLFAYFKHLQLGRVESTMASLFVGTSSGLSAVLVVLFAVTPSTVFSLPTSGSSIATRFGRSCGTRCFPGP